MTPAQKHKQCEEAKRAAALAAEIGSEVSTSQYDLMLNQLAQQKRTLSSIKSMTARNEVKAEALAEWKGYIEGILEADAGGQDQIIGQLLIWSIDTAAFDQALNIGEYMLRHNLSLPEHFQRETAEAMVEEMAEAWIKSDEPTLTLEQLRRLEQLTDSHDMHDEIRAKLHRALGEAEHKAGNDTSAILELRHAVKLNDKIGVKGLLVKLEKANPDIDQKTDSDE